MNDEQHLLASLYLDGEATVDERALAESDPDVMSEVARLAALQVAVRDVEPPTTSVREHAIASAMAQFGSRPQPAPQVAARSTVVTTMRRRPTYAWALGIAAARALFAMARPAPSSVARRKPGQATSARSSSRPLI